MLKNTPRDITRRLLRMSLLIGIPLVLIQTLLPRRASAAAKRLAPAPTSTGALRDESMPAPALGFRIQALVDELRTRLGIIQPVAASLVAENELVVSVQRIKDQAGAFSMLIEEGFANGLAEDELRAVVAHELGHVWIFTHHPYLHTEELANEIALRVVGRDSLDVVYEKVWKRTGQRGSLIYLPVE